MDKGAELSACGTYRFRLWRTWGSVLPAVFVGLNPSTADAVQDATIRRCINFARAWGFGGLVMVNLFPLRSTNPKALPGPVNDQAEERNRLAVAEASARSGILIASWGSHPAAEARYLEYLRLAPSWHCLGLTKRGAPRHPLYLRSDLKPVRYPCCTCGTPPCLDQVVWLTDLNTGRRECLQCHCAREQSKLRGQLRGETVPA